jgi:TonB-dependent starch-binding outer membrane protein SusC
VTTLNRWTPENPGATMPRAVRADPAGNNRYSDRFVENAGFMRLRNFQLGYSLPPALLARMGFVERFRIYLGGSNLFTLTPWTGLDPEEVGGIPPTRSFLLGVNATF